MRDIVDVGMGRWGAAPALRKLGVRVALAAGLGALTSVPASAATLVQQVSGSTSADAWKMPNVSVAYDRFDPSLGQLTSVTYSVATTYTYTATYDLSEMVQGSWHWSPQFQRGFGYFAGGEALLLLTPGFSGTPSLSFGPGEVGTTTSGPVTIQSSYTFDGLLDLSPATMALLTSPGTQVDEIESVGLNHIECLSATCKPNTMFTSLTVNYDVTVTYAYVAAPEPASWALMIAGFATVGATLRRRTLAA